MAGAAPNTRNWTANELPDLVGRNYHIDVNGDVEVTATNMMPVLRMRTPQGFNPRILLLDLEIVSEGGFGGQIMMWKEARFTRPTSGMQYDEADILFDGQIIKRIKVEHPKTVAPAKKAAKKKAAKKSVVKKSKSVKKAKKAAKKAAKKKTKKKAKKKAGRKKRL
jgi:hypothetical protein